MSNLSELLPAGGGGKNVDFVASGTLASGQTVILKSDGTVAAVSEAAVSGAVGTKATTVDSATEDFGAVYDTVNNKVVISYTDGSSSYYGTTAVGTISGTSISFGTPVVFLSSQPTNNNIVYDVASGKVVFVCAVAGTGGVAVVGTVSGTTVTVGSSTTFESDTVFFVAATYDSDNNKVVIVYRNTGQGGTYGIVGTVSGTSISFGSRTSYLSSAGNYNNVAYIGNSKVVVVYQNDASSSRGDSVVGTISGTSISFGSAVTFTNSAIKANSITYDSVNDKVVVVYQDFGNSSYGTGIVGTVSGTSVSWGTNSVFASTNIARYRSPRNVYSVLSGNIFIAYVDASNGDIGKYLTATVSGTSLSYSSLASFNTTTTSWLSPLAIDNSTAKVVIAYRDDSNSDYATSQVIQEAYTSTNSADFIGITNAAISNSATGEVAVQGGVITNSNFLPAVYTPSSGTPVVFEAADIGSGQGDPSIAFDSNSNKIVIAYTDVGNSSHGTAIVGTVSGNSISYGTAVVFEADTTTYPSVCFDSSNNKMVIAYRDGGASNHGKAIVGTVSGTSISFGTAVTFESANSDHISATFDSNSNKVVIAYRDDGNSSYGTAIVGTVSGTSISFGSATVFESANSIQMSAIFDSSNNKVVIAYRDFGNSSYGTAIVGTVSGTGISFGSATVYSAASSDYISATFDSSNNKVVITYQDGSDHGNAIVGTVSGTGISFGTGVVYEAAVTKYPAITFDSNANQVVISYSDNGNNDYGTMIVGTVSGTSLSFGSPVIFAGSGYARYIGTGYDSNLNKVVTAYQDGNNSNYGTSVVVTLTGASPALTIGSDYYVQDDGTLATTVSSVPAGRALSATSILLEGLS